MHHRVVYFEIPSDDPEKSMKFFKDAFGWNFRQFQSQDYWQAMTGNPENPGIDGGITKRTAGFEHVANTIRVDDVDEMTEKIEKAGGKIINPKMHVPSLGWLAHFTDPDGNLHGIVQFEKDDMSGNELVIERIFKAPLKEVWQNWAIPQNLIRWWGPKEYTSPEAFMDFREGGKYIFSMRSPEGKDFYSTGIFKEIKPMKRIVATDSFSDKNGNIVSASYYGMGDDDQPEEYLMDLSFEEEGMRTKMTLKHYGLPEDIKNMTKHGWEESFDKFEESLKK